MSNETNRAIRTEFATHNHNPDQLAACDEVRRAYSSLLDTIERTTPPGRPRSVAITKLEESCMWAIKGISIGEQKPSVDGKTEFLAPFAHPRDHSGPR